MFKKVLIANRAEIACRVIHTCKRLGIGTVAIYSHPDRNSLHVKLADHAVCVGPGPAAQSYLSIPKVIDAAIKSGADAIHPGYGFLSENPEFCRAVESAGITFIGPQPEVMQLLGDKIESKTLAERLGVPTVPSEIISGENSKIEQALLKFAKTHSFPILLKATAGGGGRGMRRVRTESELSSAYESAKREAEASFGDGRLFVEKLIESGRHVEVQIFGDSAGNATHCGDRDCTWQRRHQKIIEEAPAPNIPDQVRTHMHECAVKMAQEVKYRGAGTVEFLLDRDNAFYFLEVNSRLQVEHPVTEGITGLDLVEIQLHIANGESISELFVEYPPTMRGTSIECRICAEDPESDFAPATGTLELLRLGDAASVTYRARWDVGYRENDRVTHYYDSLLGKLVVDAPTRQEAIAAACAHLDDTIIAGLSTNIAFCRRLLQSDQFKEVTHHTTLARLQCYSDTEWHALRATLAGIALWFDTAGESAWRLSHSPIIGASYLVNGVEVSIELCASDDTQNTIQVISNNSLLAEFVNLSPYVGQNVCADLTLNPDCESPQHFDDFCAERQLLSSGMWLTTSLGAFKVAELAPRIARANKRASAHEKEVRSPLPGKVIQVLVEEGQAVETGTTLLVIESMKMEHQLHAPTDATVHRVDVAPGDTIEAHKPLIILDF